MRHTFFSLMSVLGALGLLSAWAEEPILEIDTGGHKALIRDIMFTSDGRYLVSASDDKTVRVWDVATGETVRILRGQIGPGHEGKIYAAALSPDDRWLALGGWMGVQKTSYSEQDKLEMGKIRLVDFRTGDVVALLKGHDTVPYALAFSADGQRLISGSADKTARIWDVRSDAFRRSSSEPAKAVTTNIILKGHTDLIFAVAFSPDGTIAVTGSDDHTLKLWALPTTPTLPHSTLHTPTPLRTLTGHEDHVVAAAFTPDGKYLLSGSRDSTIRLWDAKTGKFLKVLAQNDSTVESLSIAPDGSKVLTGTGSHPLSCSVFAIPSGKWIVSFSEHKNLVLATVISTDGKTAATGGGNDQEIYLWDLDTGEVRQKMVGTGKQVWSVGFGKDGKSIAWGRTPLTGNRYTPGELDQSFQLIGEGNVFEVALGPALDASSTLPHSHTPTLPNVFQRAMESVGATSIRTKDGKIHPTLHILKNDEVVHEITRDTRTGGVHVSLTLTPDGLTAVSGGSNGVLTSYDVKTGQKLHDFIGHTGTVWAVASSPDLPARSAVSARAGATGAAQAGSRLLVSGSVDQTVRLWDIPTGKLLLTIFHGTDGEWVAWTPQGYYTCSANGDRFIGWHVNQGEDKAALYYPATRFARKFYSPEIVARYVETEGDLEEAIRLVNASRPKSKRVEETAPSDLPSLFPPSVFFVIPEARAVSVSEPQSG